MSRRPDVALDVRDTSHTSAGMRAYTGALRRLLPRVAPELSIAEFGSGDNFDLAEQVGIPLTLARLRPRLVHFPTPFVPRLVTAPHVVTVHDVIDLEFPQYAKRKVAPYWRYVVGPVLRSARAVITDDDATVELLQRYLQVPAARVRVVPLGVDAPDPLPPPAVRARPYFFYAGNHRPHKDLATLVRAWSSLSPDAAVDLVLTGGVPRTEAHGNRELAVLGDVASDALWSLYRGALAYVHPALREGFGLPLLEAARAGTPVMAATTALPAVLRPFAAAFPPGDADALRALLGEALRDGREMREAATAARAATAGLTWERMAARTADVYRSLLA